MALGLATLLAGVGLTFQVNRANEQAHADRIVARATAATGCLDAIMAGGADFDEGAAAIGQLGRVVGATPKDTKAVTAAAVKVAGAHTRGGDGLTKCRGSVDAPPVCVVASTAMLEALAGQRAQVETLKQVAAALAKKDKSKAGELLGVLRGQEEQVARAGADVVNADCARVAGYRPLGN